MALKYDLPPVLLQHSYFVGFKLQLFLARSKHPGTQKYSLNYTSQKRANTIF